MGTVIRRAMFHVRRPWERAVDRGRDAVASVQDAVDLLLYVGGAGIETVLTVGRRIAVPAAFAGAAIGTAIAYPWAVHISTEHLTLYYMKLADVTVTFVLFLGAFGYLVDRRTRRLPALKRWGVWAGSVIMLFAAFRLAGFQTIFG